MMRFPDRRRLFRAEQGLDRLGAANEAVPLCLSHATRLDHVEGAGSAP
jgi:hypothetical protein